MKQGRFSLVWSFVTGLPMVLFLAFCFGVDDLEERGLLSEVRGVAFVIAFISAAVAVLKLPSWGFSLLFFSTVLVSALCAFLVYSFSKKSGVELN